MEKKRTPVWKTIVAVIAILLLLLWLTFAIVIDNNVTEEEIPIEQTGNP